MTKEDIIAKFRLYFDDGSALSDAEEEALFDKIYAEILDSRPWEITKKAYSGVTTSNDYVSLPTDFSFIVEDNNSETPKRIVYVNGSEYQLIPYSQRRGYNGNYAYLDMVNSRLYFIVAPGSGKTVEFDYVFVPGALTLTDEPIFPARFHDVIYHGMVVDENIIDMSDKAKSYAPENRTRYNDFIQRMNYWDAQLKGI